MTKTGLSTNTRTQLVRRALLTPVLIYVLLFLVAGRWDFWQGWIYAILNTLILVFMALMSFRNPELVEERLNPKQGMKTWDKVYFGITTPLYVLALVLGGLDARFGWATNMPLVIYWLGVTVYLIGQGIFLWARYTNQYFSSVVRIQTDRGQKVCTDGPYRFVRHPGYFGGMLFTGTVGILLGSWWASLPQFIAACMLIWRTAMEDKTLLAELPGYAEFSMQTRFRLIPGIW